MIAGTNVLVVDDEELDRDCMTKALGAQFCGVLEASSCDTAMELFNLHDRAVDLLVADIALPDGNGCALAIALQDQRPELRVLFVSGHVGGEVCKYYGLHVTDLHFLRKPFSEAQFVAAIEDVLRADVGFPKRYFPRRLTSSGI